MPQSFRNAPAIFQQKMDNVLRDEIGRSCFWYADDILIFCKTAKEHGKAYERIRKLLQENGLKINEEKCVFK